MRDWMRFMPFRYKISDFFSILLSARIGLANLHKRIKGKQEELVEQHQEYPHDCGKDSE